MEMEMEMEITVCNQRPHLGTTNKWSDWNLKFKALPSSPCLGCIMKHSCVTILSSVPWRLGLNIQMGRVDWFAISCDTYHCERPKEVLQLQWNNDRIKAWAPLSYFCANSRNGRMTHCTHVIEKCKKLCYSSFFHIVFYFFFQKFS